MIKNIETLFTVLAIYEDDFGCEERQDSYEPQVIVILADSVGNKTSVKQEDSWLYEQDINEDDEVYFENDKLKKPERGNCND